MLDIVTIFLLSIKLPNAKKNKLKSPSSCKNGGSNVLSETTSTTYSSDAIFHSYLIESITRERKAAFIPMFARHNANSGCTTLSSQAKVSRNT